MIDTFHINEKGRQISDVLFYLTAVIKKYPKIYYFYI